MSRVGNKPIQIPEKVKITYSAGVVSVEGVNGKLFKKMPPSVTLKIEKNIVTVSSQNTSKKCNAFHGLARSLIANMIIGVDKGFKRTLEINGIGYKAALTGTTITFNLGYSHPIVFELNAGIKASVDKGGNLVTLSSIDKELLGHVAAKIRSLRLPEPYKGKGIKYSDEYIQRKAGKTGTK